MKVSDESDAEFKGILQFDIDQAYNSNLFNSFLLALAKNQSSLLYDYFTSEKGTALYARERFTPIWYALMYYMQDTHPSEYLRMPPELEETVQEIIDKVEEYRGAYRVDV